MDEGPPAAELRLFLDSNILVSGVVFVGLEHDLLRLAAQGGFLPVVSTYVLSEVTRVLLAKFDLPEGPVNRALEALPLAMAPEPPEALIQAAEALLRDPADAPVIAAAWQANVNGLVTGDRDLFAADQRRVRVLRTREALKLVTR